MSTSILLKGEIKHKADIFNVRDTFKKQELWIEIDGDTQWPHQVPVEFVNDNIDKCVVHKYNVGDEVEVDVNIRGQFNKDKDKLFPKLQGWRLRGNPNPRNAAPETPPSDPDDLPY